MDTLGDRMRELRANGWVEEFSVDDTGVRCDACRRWAAPEDVVVDVVHRFEGPSDPGDQAILFAITMPGVHRGLLPTAYGDRAHHCRSGAATPPPRLRLRVRWTNSPPRYL